MKNQFLKNALCLSLIGSCFFASASFAAQTLYDQGFVTPDDQPSPDEQYMLELMNRARANPPAEGVYLAGITDPVVLNAYRYWNTNLSQVISDFNSYSPQPPLVFNGRLGYVARRHSNYLIDNNQQAEEETNTSDPYFTGADPLTRILSVLPLSSAIAENVTPNSIDPIQIDAGFLVDWGVSSLGHRANTMGLIESNGLAGKFNQIGISEIYHTPSNHIIGPLVVTEDFAEDGRVFVTGVVYNDLNNNGIYDQGEEIAGVSIVPSTGNYYAVSAASGGYSFPVDPNSRSPLQVTFSGGPLQQPITQTVTLTGANVKLDLNPPVLSTVSVQVPDPNTSQFTISRSDASQPLTVNLKFKGSASNGIDYQRIDNNIHFDVGEVSKTIQITPQADSAGKTVTIKLRDGLGYVVAGRKASLTIIQ